MVDYLMLSFLQKSKYKTETWLGHSKYCTCRCLFLLSFSIFVVGLLCLISSSLCRIHTSYSPVELKRYFAYLIWIALMHLLERLKIHLVQSEQLPGFIATRQFWVPVLITGVWGIHNYWKIYQSIIKLTCFYFLWGEILLMW